MSRQKVPDDKRQRTAQACDYCKRRKQKCNGTKPCSTCTKKSVTCTYATGVGPGPGTGPGTGSSMSSRPSTDDAYDDSAASSSASPPKRRHIETSSAAPTDMHPLHHHHHRLNYHSHNNSIASNISSVPSASQPKVEVDAKARLKLKSAPHSLSSARSWGGRKKEVAIELETSFLQNHGQNNNQHFASAQESGRPSTDVGLEEQTRASSTSGHEEEAILLQTTRMLQDQKGRLLYIGDSATLSFLHLFRLMVESIGGQSSFTLDPSKESIVENVVSLPPHVRPPSMLPDRQTADVLVESFFINTSAVVEVFDRHEFLAELERCYANPLMASSHFLCLLFLSFAIGLAMATPDADNVEVTAMRPLLDLPYDQAELFFRTAKVMDDPLSGIEDADFWSVQAQLLMSVYMLAASKRNAAFTYHGIAVRSAIALGLHREETMVNFSASEVLLCCNIWKSLYVLDRFIAASLGRPPAISDNDCTDIALKDAMMLPQIALIGRPGLPSVIGQGSSSAGVLAAAPPSSSSSSNHASTGGRCSKKINNFGFDASVRGCRIIGIILKKMYARRRASSRVTTDIVRQCSVWAKEMNENLRWQRTVESATAVAAGKAAHISHAQCITILHTNLFYCHAVILLTRPFFLFLIQADRRNHAASPGSLRNFFGTLSKAGSLSGTSRISSASKPGSFGSSSRYSPLLRTRTERFAENCVTASYHTIAMISQALETKYLPQRDPFIMHFLFTATLLIMTNEFIAMFHNTTYDTHIDKATRIMRFFATSDPQARRLVWILDALQDVVDKQAASTSNTTAGARTDATAAASGSKNSSDGSKNDGRKSPVRGAQRTFRFEFPKEFVSGITDPIDTFFVLQPAHAKAGGGAVPFGGNRLGDGVYSSNTRHGPRSQLTQPPAEAGSGAGSAQILAQPSNCIHVDTSFAGRPQSGNEHSQPGLLGLANTGLSASIAALLTDSTQHGGMLLGNNNGTAGYGGEGGEGAMAANPLVLPPPFSLSAALPPADFSPQFQAQPQHHHHQQQHHQHKHQHQHPLHFSGDTGGEGLGPEAYQAMDSKAIGDLDGADSIETDGEGFDFDILWNWPNQVGQVVVADGTSGTAVGMDDGGGVSTMAGVNMGLSGLETRGVPNTMDYVHPEQQQQGSSTDMSAFGDGSRGQGDSQGSGQGGGEMDMKQGSAPTHNAPMPLPPMYSPYGMAPLSSSVGGSGLGLSGVHGHGNMVAPLNVPLYATTDFG